MPNTIKLVSSSSKTALTPINKFPYLDKKGNRIIGGKLTGWVFSDAVRQTHCPKCQSSAGYHCQTPKGKQTWPPHTQRLQELNFKFPEKNPS